MANAQVRWLSLTDIRERMKHHSFIRSSIPVEHAISFPLPTRRWIGPAYAYFASPALRLPGQSLKQGAPDRWWVVSAHGGQIILYTLYKALPFTENEQWGTLILPTETRSIAEQQQAIATIELLVNRLAPAFFDDEPGDQRTRTALMESLSAHLPKQLLPQYQALVPDFFAWLKE